MAVISNFLPVTTQKTKNVVKNNKRIIISTNQFNYLGSLGHDQSLSDPGGHVDFAINKKNKTFVDDPSMIIPAKFNCT